MNVKFNYRYPAIAIAVIMQLVMVNHVMAQNLNQDEEDIDIYTEPLFSDETVSYEPIAAKDLEVEKLNALKNKDDAKMYAIGMMYRDGRNVDVDLTQAQEWFLKAARDGNVNAMIELARLFSLDKEFTGVDKNQIEAQNWIQRAVDTGDAKALYIMGTMYEDGFPFGRSYEKSVEYYKQAAAKGVINAYVKLYIAYQYGKGVEPNLETAIYWLRMIENNAPDGKIKKYANEMLSEAYFEIGYKEKDPVLKFKLFNLAWSKGNRYAIEAIGDMFQAGIGVKQSYSSAVVAYETAIKSFESVYAMERLGFIYLKGPSEISADYKKAFDLFFRAANLGGVTASYELGYMYYYGVGVDRNPKEAQKWFDRSKQLASKDSNPRFHGTLTNSQSTKQLREIINSATMRDAEYSRQRNLEQQINDGSNGQDIKQINEVPRY
jgi:TPR repeat protein